MQTNLACTIKTHFYCFSVDEKQMHKIKTRYQLTEKRGTVLRNVWVN
jgi:hypothetical protein